MLVFSDSEKVEVIQHEGTSEDLLITFGSLGYFGLGGVPLADGKIFWGRSFCERHGLNALGFMPKAPHRYCQADMDRAIEAVRPIIARYARVMTYGSSMGAYAALRFSRALGATTALAIAPQYSIDPDEVGAADPRYRYLFRAGVNRGMALRRQDIIEDGALVIHDPFCEEDRHNARLIALASPRVRFVPAFFAGHECVRLFADANIALELLQLAQARDLPQLLRLVTAARRSSAVRAARLAEAALSTRPLLGQAIFDAHGKRFDKSQTVSFHVARVDRHLVHGEFDAAEAALADVMAVAPDHPPGVQRAQQIRARRAAAIPPLISATNAR